MSPEGDERAAGRSGRQEPRPAPGRRHPSPARDRGRRSRVWPPWGASGCRVSAQLPRCARHAHGSYPLRSSSLPPGTVLSLGFHLPGLLPHGAVVAPPTCQGLLGCWGSALEPGSPSCRPACSLVGEGVTQTSDGKGWSWKCPLRRCPWSQGRATQTPASSCHRKEHGQSEHQVRSGHPATGRPRLYGEWHRGHLGAVSRGCPDRNCSWSVRRADGGRGDGGRAGPHPEDGGACPAAVRCWPRCRALLVERTVV